MRRQLRIIEWIRSMDSGRGAFRPESILSPMGFNGLRNRHAIRVIAQAKGGQKDQELKMTDRFAGHLVRYT